eukprot:GFUD01031977.1.p1 GENE.GFUD01031977.1~~GFUD01031977.1.p1  ORF type:complete len:285 (-),score=71.59 GFUD01031977.1:250-1104(-)
MSSETDSEIFNLSWNDFDLCTGKIFRKLISDQDFTDVTLVCVGNKQVKAHKVILSACSPFFRTLLLSNPQHPNPLVYLKGVQYSDLLSIIQFIYLGQTHVEQSNLDTFMETAKELEIQGLITDSSTRQGRQENEEGGTIKKETIWMGDTFQARTIADTEIEDPENVINVDDSLEMPLYNPMIVADTDIEESIAEDPEDEIHANDSLQVSLFNPLIENHGFVSNKLGSSQKKKRMGDQCDQCDYRGQHVKEHIMSVHEKIKFSCDMCDKVYSHPNNLRTHKKSKH